MDHASSADKTDMDLLCFLNGRVYHIWTSTLNFTHHIGKSSEGLDKLAHPRSFTKAFTACTHKVIKYECR